MNESLLHDYNSNYNKVFFNASYLMVLNGSI